MKEGLKHYLIIISYLIVGLLIMGVIQFLKMPDWLPSSFVVLALFIIVNIITSNIFQLKSEIRVFWTFKKIYFLPIGVLMGALIAISPIIIGLLYRKITLNELTLNTTFTT